MGIRDRFADAVGHWVQTVEPLSRTVLIVAYVLLIALLFLGLITLLSENLNGQVTERQVDAIDSHLARVEEWLREVSQLQVEVQTRQLRLINDVAHLSNLSERLTILEADRKNDRWILVTIIGLLIAIGVDRLRSVIKEKN